MSHDTSNIDRLPSGTARRLRSRSKNAKGKVGRILLITELSDESRMAYTHATIIARKFNAKLFLGFIGRRRALEYSGISHEDHRNAIYRELRQECCHKEFADIEIEFRLLCNRNIKRSIESFEQASRPDLVITTTEAIGGWKRFFSNDKAPKVIESSSVPVWMVGPAVTFPKLETPKRVLVPFDFSDKAFGTLPLIRLMAYQYGCAFKLVRIRKNMNRESIFGNRLSAKEQRPRVIRRRFAKLIDEELEGIEIETEVSDGEPHVESRRLAREMDANLIVVTMSLPATPGEPRLIKSNPSIPGIGLT